MSIENLDNSYLVSITPELPDKLNQTERFIDSVLNYLVILPTSVVRLDIQSYEEISYAGSSYFLVNSVQFTKTNEFTVESSEKCFAVSVIGDRFIDDKETLANLIAKQGLFSMYGV